MNDFNEIFARHYFSNHYTEAINIEKYYENKFKNYNCITFSNVEALIIAIIDEICDKNYKIYYEVNREKEKRKINGLNKYLEVTQRIVIEEKKIVDNEDIVNVFGSEAFMYKKLIFAYISRDNKHEGLILELNNDISMLNSAGLFVTKNLKFAEKIRWSRSSYGRRNDSDIKIAANGRFSEFQGYILNNFK
jgi:hypothetical protein